MVAVAERLRGELEVEQSERAQEIGGGASELARTDDDLAQAINAEHGRVEEHKHKTIRHAIRCGELLLEMKQRVGHGNWLAWVAEHFEASERTARNYMEIAKSATVADLDEDMTMRSALRALAAPSRSREPKAEQAESPQDKREQRGGPLAAVGAASEDDAGVVDAEVIEAVEAIAAPRAGLGRTHRRTWTSVPTRLTTIQRAFSEAAGEDLDDQRASEALYAASREAHQAAVELERLAAALEKRAA
jgi:hypothetical protein